MRGQTGCSGSEKVTTAESKKEPIRAFEKWLENRSETLAAKATSFLFEENWQSRLNSCTRTSYFLHCLNMYTSGTPHDHMLTRSSTSANSRADFRPGPHAAVPLSGHRGSGYSVPAMSHVYSSPL